MNKIYLKIPESYKEVFDAIAERLDNYGANLIEDCSTDCKSESRDLISCWNMFQAACCTFNRQNYKRSDFLINYIITKLRLGIPKVESSNVEDIELITIDRILNVTSMDLISGDLVKYIDDRGTIFTDKNYTVVKILKPQYNDVFVGELNSLPTTEEEVNSLNIPIGGDYLYLYNNDVYKFTGTPYTYTLSHKGGNISCKLGDIVSVQTDHVTYKNTTVKLVSINGIAVAKLNVEGTTAYLVYSGGAYTFSRDYINGNVVVVNSTANIEFSKVNIEKNNLFDNATCTITNDYNIYTLKTIYSNEIYFLSILNIYTSERVYKLNKYSYQAINLNNSVEIIENTGANAKIPFVVNDTKINHLKFIVDDDWLTVVEDWFKGDETSINIMSIKGNDNPISRKTKIKVLYEGDIIASVIVVQESNENNNWE